MLEITNLGEFSAGIDKWLVEVERVAIKFCRGVSVQIFRHILINSVQYSGDFAANWKYSLNVADTSFEVDAVWQIFKSNKITWMHGKKDEEKREFYTKFKRLDATADTEYAIAYALRKNRGRDRNFKLGDEIIISNSVRHDEDYVAGIETGSTKLKDSMNHAPVARAVKSVLSSIHAPDVNKYSYDTVTKVSYLDSLRRRPTANALGA